VQKKIMGGPVRQPSPLGDLASLHRGGRTVPRH
jgi:hypothetical protein